MDVGGDLVQRFDVLVLYEDVGDVEHLTSARGGRTEACFKQSSSEEM